jgi:hypothetical protein
MIISNYYTGVNKQGTIMSQDVTRRKLLRAGAGAAALGAVGSLSGCSAIRDLNPFGGGGLGEFTNWVYAPDTFESDTEGLSVRAVSYSGILSNSGSLSEATMLSYKQRSFQQLGIDAEDIDMRADLPNGRVYTGSFDTEAVKEELQAGANDEAGAGNNEYESEATYEEDYEIFAIADQDEPSHAYAVGNGAIVRGNRVSNFISSDSEVSAEDVVKGIIDSGTNGENRFTESNDTFGTLVDKTNTGVSVSLELRAHQVGSDDGQSEDVKRGHFDGLVASGNSLQINGDTSTYQYVYVYDSEGDVNESEIQEWIEANDTGNGSLSDLDDISVNTDGNTATVTGTRDTIEL